MAITYPRSKMLMLKGRVVIDLYRPLICTKTAYVGILIFVCLSLNNYVYLQSLKLHLTHTHRNKREGRERREEDKKAYMKKCKIDVEVFCVVYVSTSDEIIAVGNQVTYRPR